MTKKNRKKCKSCNRETDLSSLSPICPVLLSSSDPIAKMAHLWLSVFPQLGNRKVGSSVDKREKS